MHKYGIEILKSVEEAHENTHKNNTRLQSEGIYEEIKKSFVAV